MPSAETFSERYKRQLRIKEVGPDGQQKILEAKVLVVGAGALGCAALVYLVPAGVGVVGVLDNDEVDITNLHRQILYSQGDLGKPKAVAAKDRLRAMNPEVEIRPHFLRIHKDNALEIIKDYDLVLDCSDNFPTKFLVNDACVMLNKPCIIGAAIGFSGQLSVYNYKDGPTYRCLLPEPPDSLTVPTCADTGVMGMIPGIIGTLQALEAIKIIIGKGDVLSGRLLHFEGLDAGFTEFDIKTDPMNKEISELTEYEISCPDFLLKKHLINGRIFLEKLTGMDNISVIALGEEGDVIQYKDFKWDLIPLYKTPEVMKSLPSGQVVLLICEYGIRSLEALKYLLIRENYTNVYALKDGLAELRTLEL
jgi:sulfur-carrier protein adenylyltransferase/sulfurtransferase